MTQTRYVGVSTMTRCFQYGSGCVTVVGKTSRATLISARDFALIDKIRAQVGAVGF